MWTCSEMKKTGWNRLSGTFWTAVALTVVLALITGALPMIQNAISSVLLLARGDVIKSLMSGTNDFETDTTSYTSQTMAMNGLSYLISFLSLAATFLLINPLNVGYAQWFLVNRNEGEKPSISLLFSSLKSGKFGPTVAGMAWRTLWTMIWGFVAALCLAPFYIMFVVVIVMAVVALFSSGAGLATNDTMRNNIDYSDFSQRFMDIAPVLLIVLLVLFVLGLAGCIAISLNRKYAYMFTPFILAEKSNIGSGKALDLSKQMAQGMKWKLFILDLSFIGWHLLSMLTLGLLSLGITPYLYATYTEVYENRKNEMAIVLL